MMDEGCNEKGARRREKEKRDILEKIARIMLF